MTKKWCNNSAENPRLREYGNAALDILKTFEKYELAYIPRAQNSLENKIAFAASNFQIPLASEKYTLKVKHDCTVSDNIDYWQVLEGDEQIDDFFHSRNEFTLKKPSLGHEGEVSIEEKTLEIELPHFDDINLLTHPY